MTMDRIYIGIDIGSITANAVAIDSDCNILATEYIRTSGDPIVACQTCLEDIKDKLPKNAIVGGIGTTGSARYLVGNFVDADLVKNEITAHAISALFVNPEVRTVIEIGGQDSKIIILNHGVVVDFAMNTVCAAGTGAFLDEQAARLGLGIDIFSQLADESKSPIRIAGRCTVFAESDMIHKQQSGYRIRDIVAGVCESLVRNYLNDVGKGKNIQPPIMFQGGVAANLGIRAALRNALKQEIIVPKYYNVMGAIGIALLVKDRIKDDGQTRFRGFGLLNNSYSVRVVDCSECENACEVMQIYIKKTGEIVASWQDRCGKWQVEQMRKK